MPLLAVEDLRVEFHTRSGTVQALDGIGFEVRRGEMMALVGESGSGKSVTAYAIMGILDAAARITSGRITFGGLDLLTAGDKAMDEIRGRELAIIFQNPRTALNPIRPVGKQIADILLQHGNVTAAQAPRRAIEMLAKVRIPDPERRAAAPPEAPLPIRYRLPHERLIAPLRRLSGQLIADADRVVLGFQLAVQTWVGRGKRKGDLLSGRELRRALTHNDTVLAGGALGERTEFLRLSVRRRDQRRATIAFASVVVLVVFFWGGRLYTDFQHRQTLAAWGVPGDLYDHQSQLVDLSIAVPITDLGWVRAPLRSLTIISNSPRFC